MFYVPIIVSIFAIIFALFLIKEINKSPSGSKEMTHISQAIREEAMVFLKREYVVIAIFSVFLFFILFALLGFKVVLGFLIGALFSGLIGLLGIVISTKTNLKVAQASKQDICYALGISFKGGLAIAFLAAGIGLFSVSGVYLLTKNIQALIALGFGCSLVSIFTCLGGVIYAKSADIGAGLAGEQKKDIQKRNPKNSVVILDLIRDNIGNCASVITDLFGTYVVIMVATMALGNLIFPGQAIAILIPIYLAACALLSSIIASFFTRIKNRSKNIISIFYKGILITGVLTAFSFFWVLKAGTFFLNLSFVNFYLSFLTGLIVASGLFLITGYYSSEKHCPVFSIARASKTEHTINIIDGLSTGIQSIGLRIILVFTGIFFSFWLGGIYGISICVVSTLFLILLVIAINSYGLITGNASGIVEMSGENNCNTREATDSLKLIGRTAKATAKTYAISSVAIASLILFLLYTQEIKNFGNATLFNLESFKILIGLFIGGAIPCLFSSFALTSVNKTGGKVVEKARRQFREIKGLISGKTKPEYGKCVDVVAKASLKEMILPAMFSVIIPIVIGFVLGTQALGGFLIGSIITGFFITTSIATREVAWDNAKKYIKKGGVNKKNSFVHQTAATGDTVGNPYKGAVEMAINPMIMVFNIVSLLIVGFLV